MSLQTFPEGSFETLDTLSPFRITTIECGKFGTASVTINRRPLKTPMESLRFPPFDNLHKSAIRLIRLFFLAGPWRTDSILHLVPEFAWKVASYDLNVKANKWSLSFLPHWACTFWEVFVRKARIYQMARNHSKIKWCQYAAETLSVFESDEQHIIKLTGSFLSPCRIKMHKLPIHDLISYLLSSRMRKHLQPQMSSNCDLLVRLSLWWASIKSFDVKSHAIWRMWMLTIEQKG